jgi:signal transduction histidine kinase
LNAPQTGSAAGLLRITRPASAAIIVVVAVTVAAGAGGKSPAVIGAAAAALLAAAAGTALLQFGPGWPAAPDMAIRIAIGLAGAVLSGVLPATPAFVIVYLALAAIAIRLPPGRALAAAIIVFAAMNLAVLLANQFSAAGLASQDIGAAFVFAVGAFTRSARFAQDLARAAQARAEDLLAQLQASQAAQAEAAALTERTRLAREIHDVLAHALSGLVLALDTMELLGRQAAADPRALERMLEQVSRGQRMARDGLADSRRAIAALRGDELPGPAALDRLVSETAAATGITAGLTVMGVRRALGPETGLTLYRAAQEALTNSAKHAGRGSRVELCLTYHEDTVELVVRDTRPDNSRDATDATDATDALTFGGYGLTGMRERAELLGGTLTAGPAGAGFAVRLLLPAAPATAATPADGGRP